MVRAAQASPDSGLLFLLFLERVAAKTQYIYMNRLYANTLLREKHRVPRCAVWLWDTARSGTVCGDGLWETALTERSEY